MGMLMSLATRVSLLEKGNANMEQRKKGRGLWCRTGIKRYQYEFKIKNKETETQVSSSA